MEDEAQPMPHKNFQILLIGGSGQIGQALRKLEWPNGVKLIYPKSTALDISSADKCRDFLRDHNWAAIINCAAYTAVDRAEMERSKAFNINAQGAGFLADFAEEARIPLIHLSTDYVFDGSKSGWYHEEDLINPINTYGASKASGEIAVRFINPSSLILRTSWVYSRTGNNFLNNIRKLSEEKTKLNIIYDQIGCPTSATDIANAIKIITMKKIKYNEEIFGIYHLANSGSTSWFNLAKTYFDIFKDGNIIIPEIMPVSSSEYKSLAKRPLNSKLSTDKISRNFGIRLRHWEVALKETFYG